MTKLNVLIIGSGGREHALVKAVRDSKMLNRLVCTPANGGIAKECETKNIAVESIQEILDFCKSEKINFVICGPEVPLSLGLADTLRANNIAVYGPNKDGAMLETSKSFSKHFLKKYNIPTAAGESFSDFAKAKEFIEKAPFDVVVKASGLAAGKGVIIPDTKAEAIEASRQMLEEKSFGESSSEIVVEEKMIGEEVSIMLMVCKDKFIMLPPSQDHKRIGERDTGLNTGGMGAYAPASVLTPSAKDDVINNIVKPSLSALIAENIDYRGTLYVGIMLTDAGAKVVEYNVRFGDPECQVLMPLINGDALELMYSIAIDDFNDANFSIKNEYSATVVMTAKGYPEAYEKGKAISLPQDKKDAYIIHSGTKQDSSGQILSNGGRVLCATAIAPTLEGALEKAYELCDKTNFDGVYFRRDIAHRQLSRNKNEKK